MTTQTKAGVKPVTSEPPTKAAFLIAYRERLVKQYAWAQDADRLKNVMKSARFAITGGQSIWNPNGPVGQDAYAAIGCMGRVSLKALQALPVGRLEDVP